MPDSARIPIPAKNARRSGRAAAGGGDAAVPRRRRRLGRAGPRDANRRRQHEQRPDAGDDVDQRLAEHPHPGHAVHEPRDRAQGEVGGVAGGAQIEIARGVPSRACRRGHDHRGRKHHPGRLPRLVEEEAGEAHQIARRWSGDRQQDPAELGQPKGENAQHDQPERIAQAAPLRLDARRRGPWRDDRLADPRRESPGGRGRWRRAHRASGRLRSYRIANPCSVSMSSHSSMVRASRATRGARPPVPTTRGAKSISPRMRPTMASTRPA